MKLVDSTSKRFQASTKCILRSHEKHASGRLVKEWHKLLKD